MSDSVDAQRSGDAGDDIPREGGAAVELYWLPLGAGGRFVRFNGRVYEAISSKVEHRPACDLYHSALEVTVESVRHVIEVAPAAGDRDPRREVVAEGAVGAGWAGRLRIFRYEVRRWRDGQIADIGEAVDSPVRLSREATTSRRVLGTVPEVPTPTWGRDELEAGDMWNSNSVISWLLVRSGIDATRINLPEHGRAPGWSAGIEIAGRASARRKTVR